MNLVTDVRQNSDKFHVSCSS